jgi:FkbM family methyltransferase
VFDRAYLERNFEDLRSVYHILSDDASRRFFCQLVLFKLTGKPEDLWKLDEHSVDHSKKIGDVKVFCDLGAYVGDTVEEWKERSPSLRCVVAIEPEVRHFRKLCDRALLFEKTVFVNAAASDHDGEISFAVGKGRGSSVSTSQVIEGLRPNKLKTLSCRSLDSVLEEHCVCDVDLIKYDVEGWERLAIAGSRKTLERYLPNVIVSLYHNHEDLFRIPLMLQKILPSSCQYFLSRKKRCFPAWEVELTIISNNVQNAQK